MSQYSPLPATAPAPTDQESEARKKRYRIYALLATIVLAPVIGRLVAGSLDHGVTYRQAPPETRGVWTTHNSRYAGRQIHVTPSHVMLVLGNAGSAVSGELSIAREFWDDDDRVLRLEYVTSDGPDAIEMVVGPGGTMHMRNQPDISWSVEGAPPMAVPTTQLAEGDGDGSGAPLGPIAIGLLLLGLTGVMLRARSGSEGDAIAAPSGTGAPRIIRGVWTSPDPRMKGQSIRIADEYGFSQFGPGEIRIGGTIEAVKQWREEGSQVVSLRYRTAEGTNDLEMVIDRAGYMRLRNGPKALWVRRAS